MKTFTGDFEAIKEPSPCPQKSVDGDVIGKEDCLFLNVFAPQVFYYKTIREFHVKLANLQIK